MWTWRGTHGDSLGFSAIHKLFIIHDLVNKLLITEISLVEKTSVIFVKSYKKVQANKKKPKR